MKLLQRKKQLPENPWNNFQKTLRIDFFWIWRFDEFFFLIISVDKDEAVREEKAAARKSMKEVEESAGLLERPSDDDLDDEVKLINGFDLGTPLTLQATQHVTGNFYFIFSFPTKVLSF